MRSLAREKKMPCDCDGALVGAAEAWWRSVQVVVVASAAGALVGWRDAAGARVAVFEARRFAFMIGFVGRVVAGMKGLHS